MLSINFTPIYSLLAFLFIAFSSQAQTTLIAPHAAWKYYDAGNEPTGAWTSLAYDDSTWASGNAELGYGDNDEATVVNSSAQTIYFRHSFTVTDPVNYLLLEMLRDDGAVVYLNGVEVWRDNMPTGTVDYSTFASLSLLEGIWHQSEIVSNLVVGVNVLAVEVHQYSAGSSDISFDFELTAKTDLINPEAAWKYYDAANEPSGSWESNGYDDSSWGNGNAQLGYGETDEATTLCSCAQTVYFRKSFEVTDPSIFPDFTINMLRDDGAVVYLNGAEVWRSNMPTNGTIDYSTFASSTAFENIWVSQVIPNTLLTGTNVIAVEVHQRSATSSDISFDFEIFGNGAVSIVRGPYLQKGTANSMTLRWRTATPTESIVNYGNALGNLTNTTSDLTIKTEHSITISGLTANTVYYYNIANTFSILKSEASDLYFKTSPTIGSQTATTMWVLGDCGTANANQRAVRDAYYNYIGSDHTDITMFLGDNAYTSGTDSEYQSAIFENMYEAMLQKSVSWSTLGNHDGYSANSTAQSGPYYDIFTLPTAAEAGGVASGTEAYYSFDHGNIHFVVLNSYDVDRSVGATMYNWCQNDLQNTTADWIIAVWHHPAYTKGSHDSDSESALIEMRENFNPLLESYGVDLILNGHSHSYERSYFLNGHYGFSNTFNSVNHTVGLTGDGDGKVDGDGIYSKTGAGPTAGEGAVYITAGSSGKISNGSLDHAAMFVSLKELGSCVVEVDGNEMNVKFLRETGAIDDYFTITKNTVLPVELTSFEAIPFDHYAQLKWRTAIEVNNLGFEVQRSSDGLFWDNIAWVEGMGTTHQPQYYEYIDHRVQAGDVYYRLRQVDEDGHFEYSGIEQLFFERITTLNIFPNPASQILQVDYEDIIEEWTIYDVSGKKMEQVISNHTEIDISMLEEGMYILEVRASGKQFYKQFAVQ